MDINNSVRILLDILQYHTTRKRIMCKNNYFEAMESVLWILLIFVVVTSTSRKEKEVSAPPSMPIPDSQSTKLVILVLDGFRWDYYDRQKHQLPGFRQLVTEGVQVEYVEPIFPSLSFPSWTTIVTGLYPSHHNILGNYMLRLADEQFPETVFQLKDNSTKMEMWWQSAEPLWITATKSGQKVYLANFANCDVPFHGVNPTECTGYQYKDVNFKLREQLNKALIRFRQGYSLAMIYDDSIDHAGHAWGPDSNELKLALVHLDTLLQEFFINMKYHGMLDRVNVIITSDHGMTSIKKETGTEYVKLEDYVTDSDDIYKVIDSGAVMSIAASEGRSESLFQQLSIMPGVDVYRKKDIPDKFHYKESRLVHDLLLVARPGYFIVGLNSDKQIPYDSKASTEQPYRGSHGYYNITDMRTIFFARGPAFKQGIVHPGIRMEDEYQIFTHVLDIKPCAHNGTWENVNGIFSGFEG